MHAWEMLLPAPSLLHGNRNLVFTNAKRDAGCVRVVKLQQTLQHRANSLNTDVILNDSMPHIVPILVKMLRCVIFLFFLFLFLKDA